MGKSYYEILGVNKDASQQEIRQAYRSLAKQWHPDKNDSAEAHERFAEINQAHQTLSEPVKRRLYDLRLQVGNVFSGPPPWATARKKPSPEEQRRQYWQSKAGQARKKELEREAAIFSKINRVLSIVAYISLALGLILTVEKFFSNTKGPEIVVDLASNMDAMNAHNFHEAVRVTTSERQFKMDLNLSQCLGKGDSISIYKGPILGLITHIRTEKFCKESYSYEFDPRKGLFAGTFYLVYFVILLCLVVILVKDKMVKAGLGVLNLLFFLVILSLVIMNL